MGYDFEKILPADRFWLVLAGDGPDRDRIQELALELKVDGRLTLPGVVPIENLYRFPDVVALSSRTESMPLTLLEARACGVPIVASELTAIREIIDHDVDGLLVTPGDPEAFASAITRLQGDPDLLSVEFDQDELFIAGSPCDGR